MSTPQVVSPALPLASLLALDLLLSAWAFLAPELWFGVFHDSPYVDPQGLLRRMGANWLAFALIQAIALARWKKAPYWLAVVAGARFGDALTDWTYLAFAESLTWFGRTALLAASPANAVAGWWLLRAWKRITSTS